MSLDHKQTAAAAAPLPRGRHNLSRADVLSSQRNRLVAAVLECVAAKGYPATTVSDVVSAARVSRNAFYELFADKEDCFLAAADERGAETLELLYAQEDAETWIEAVRSGTRIYLERWAEDESFARAYLIELPAAGRRAQEQRDRIYARFARMFEAIAARARAEQLDLAPLPPLVPRLLVTGITETVAAEVRADRIPKLSKLEPELSAYVIKMLADDETAARAMANS